ncbi:hypothetical protein GM160_05545 [Guyparkeria halophila]|uniref:Uncharacterized protein n=1 Tax=Guyparkeria halophila TaxID=47960 RepID=A0A6I6DA33_9GAMM|nr:hypothetical protein [Guyparkeria halophila]QGT78402.1 hypothetical protein GM160_05545 [Guyparkeria halophila]
MSSRNFRYPPVLADQLRVALRHIRSIDEQHGEGSALDFLERHRRNKGRMLTSALAQRDPSPVEIEPIPWELKTSGMLDEIHHAFQAMHRYREGGAGEYISRDVYAEVRDEVVSDRQRQAGKAAAEQHSAKAAEMKQALVARARELKASDELRRNSYYQRLERFISDEFSETRTRRCIQGWLKEAGVEPPPI